MPILLHITQQKQQYYHDGNDQLNQMLVNKSNQKQKKKTRLYINVWVRERICIFSLFVSQSCPVSGVLFISHMNKFCCMIRTSEKRKVARFSMLQESKIVELGRACAHLDGIHFSQQNLNLKNNTWSSAQNGLE